MRTATTTFDVYKFQDLSDTAKERVIYNYINSGLPDELFYEDITEDIKDMFPNSNLDIKYSLSYCQDDGLNIYGTLNFADLDRLRATEEDSTWYKKVFPLAFEEIKGYTDKEWRTLEFYLKDKSIYLPDNYRYTYGMADYIRFADEAIEQLEYLGIRDINRKLLERFESTVRQLVHDYCLYCEEVGYDSLYNIREDEMEEICDMNGWEFDENGELWAWTN